MLIDKQQRDAEKNERILGRALFSSCADARSQNSMCTKVLLSTSNLRNKKIVWTQKQITT
jgi:hypothetical protein